MRQVLAPLALVGLLLGGMSSAGAAEAPQPSLSAEDCGRLEQLHIGMQANLPATQLAAACRGQRTQPLRSDSPIGEPSQLLFSRLGGSDLNLISDDESGAVPAVTQAGSVAWAEGDDIVAVYHDTRDLPDSFSGMSVSIDAGANFTRLTNPFVNAFGTDLGSPSVVYSTSAAAWFAVALDPDCGGQGIGVMTNSGDPETSGSWVAASPACAHSGTADDRPIMWVDNNVGSAFYGRIYVAFNDFASSGDLKVVYLDGGAWTEVTVNSGTFVRNVHLTGSRDVDGSVHIFGMDEGGGAGASRLNWVYRSTDGGAVWTGVQPGPSYPPVGAGLCAASNYFYMVPPVWRHMGWGQGAVSAGAGPTAADNVLHYVWARAGQVPGDLGDIYYIRSTDNGASWSTGVPINTDQQLNNNVVQWLPSISVTTQGYVLASWLDRRGTTDGLDYEVYGRVSLDNGATFGADEPISDAPIPQPTQVDPAIDDCFAGDSAFHGVASNDVLVTWTDGRNELDLTPPPPPPPPALGQTARGLDQGVTSQMDVYFARVPLCPAIDVTPDVLPNGELTAMYSETLSASGGNGPYTYALAGSLPDGLGLAGDLISGTPTTAGTVSFSIVATDSLGCEGTQAYSLIVDPTGCPAIGLDPADLLDGDQGAPYSDTVTASGGTGPYDYAVTGGTLPVGLSLDPASGEVSGAAQESGTFDVNLTATDANLCTGTQSYNFVIACPTITLSPEKQLADAFAGEPYLDNITGNGGTPPYTYFVETGTTHNGVFLGEGGTIFGMTEAGGTKQFRVVATDANGCFNTNSHQFRVDSFNCFDGAILCDDMGDIATSFTTVDNCAPRGATAEWYSENGCPSSNDIAHTPSAHARWGTMGDCADYGAGAAQSTMASLEMDSSVCNSGEVILDFNYLLSFDGNPDTERARVEVVADGGMPEVVADNGGIDGPTCSGLANAGLGNLKSWSGWQHLQMTLPAASTFQVNFVGETDDGSTAVDSTDGFEGFMVDDVHVRCKCPDDFIVEPTLLEPAIAGAAYSVQFTASGGREPYVFETLPGSPTPTGLTLDPATGLLSGTPTTEGIQEFTLVVKDANFCEIRVILSLIVSPAACDPITIDPLEMPDEVEGVFYSELITPTGTTGPDPIFALTAGELPSGLSLSPTLGVISGTPDTPGIYQFMVTVVDELTFCSASQEYSIIINPVGCPVIDVQPEALPNAGAGDPYEETFSATGGIAPYSWFVSLGELPVGLELDETAGTISGVPSGNEVFGFQITAQDQDGCFGTRTYGLEVVDRPPRVERMHSVSSTGGGELSSGESTHAALTQIYVDFNEAVTDATNTANFLLAAAGADRTRDTTSCVGGVDPADVAVVIDSVTYDAETDTAAVRVNGGTPLPYGAYRLIACSTLEDSIGQGLDGDGDFTGGDDFVFDFGVDVDNILVNPNFDDDLTGWTASAVTETTHSTTDADLAPTSGSAGVATVASPATVSQCLDVTDDEGYFFAGKGWIESLLSTDPSLTAEIRFFSGAACGGSTLSTESLVGPSGDSDGGLLFADGFECGDTSRWGGGGAPCVGGPEWAGVSSWMATPSGSVSAEIRWIIDPGAATTFDAFVDDVQFFHMLFGDGFESGDTSAW